MSANPCGAEKWESVKSSNIDAIGVRGDWLIVKFGRNGSIYRYEGFASLFDDLVASESVGKLFRQEVLTHTGGQKLFREEWPDDI
jgi:hypothetical protein